MSQWVFILLGLGSIVGALSMGGSGAVFLDLPSALIVVVVGFAFSIAAHGVGHLFAALTAGFRSVAHDDEDTELYAVTLQTLRSSLCAAGAAGFLIGLVKMLQNMSDPSMIGPAMAVACLTALYAVVLAELVVSPMISRLRLRSTSDAASQPLEASPEVNA